MPGVAAVQHLTTGGQPAVVHGVEPVGTEAVVDPLIEVAALVLHQPQMRLEEVQAVDVLPGIAVEFVAEREAVRQRGMACAYRRDRLRHPAHQLPVGPGRRLPLVGAVQERSPQRQRVLVAQVDVEHLLEQAVRGEPVERACPQLAQPARVCDRHPYAGAVVPEPGGQGDGDTAVRTGRHELVQGWLHPHPDPVGRTPRVLVPHREQLPLPVRVGAGQVRVGVDPYRVIPPLHQPVQRLSPVLVPGS